MVQVSSNIKGHETKSAIAGVTVTALIDSPDIKGPSSSLCHNRYYKLPALKKITYFE